MEKLAEETNTDWLIRLVGLGAEAHLLETVRFLISQESISDKPRHKPKRSTLHDDPGFGEKVFETVIVLRKVLLKFIDICEYIVI